MTVEEFQKTEWFLQRPELIQKAIITLPPICHYKFKNSGKQCYIISYDEPESQLLEDVTVTVQKTGVGGAMAEMGMGQLDTNQVFGVKLDDLEKWTDDIN